MEARRPTIHSDHALEVQDAARLLRDYVERRRAPGLFQVHDRMALGVTKEEVAGLEKRYEVFKDDYPDLKLMYGDELQALEPKVMLGRKPGAPVCALVSDQGYALINYQLLAECFVEDAQSTPDGLSLHFDTDVKKVARCERRFVLDTDKGEFRCKVVVFASGAYSPLVRPAARLRPRAQDPHLCVAGDFYSVGDQVNGKVYRPQIEGRPFAELHMDKDVLASMENRFGPTTVPVALMERYHYWTFFDFLKLPTVSFKGLWILLRILFENELFGYVAKNLLFRVPVIGTLLLLKGGSQESFRRSSTEISSVAKAPEVFVRRSST